MSLINDALNRAKAEASRRAASERGEMPAVPTPPPEATPHQVPAWIWAAGAVMVVIIALLWFRTPTAPAGEPAEVLPPTLAAATPAAPSATEEIARALPPEPEPRPIEASPASGQEAAPQSAVATPSPPTAPVTQPAPAAAPQRLTLKPAPAAATEAPRASEPAPVEADLAEPLPAAARVASPPSVEAPPAAVWPDGAGAGDQQIWYYVDKIVLPGGGEIELGGIAWSANAPSAILNGSLLRVGSEILGLEVVEIGPRTVILTGQGRRLALQLGSGN